MTVKKWKTSYGEKFRCCHGRDTLIQTRILTNQGSRRLLVILQGEGILPDRFHLIGST